MLDLIRDRAQSIGVKVIFGIIIIVFVFWGVGNIGAPSAGSLAVVNGENVSVQDFSREFNRIFEEQRKLRPELSGDIEAVKLLKREVLAEVILSRLRRQEAARLGLVVTPHELRRLFESFTVFQNAQGKFDPQVYAKVLATQNMTPGAFEAEYSAMLLEQKLLSSIGMSVDVSEAEAKTLYSFSLEKRRAEYALFSVADYKKDVPVSGEEIERYYADNKESFRTPVRADIEFLRVTPDTLAAAYPVTDQEAEAYYEKNKLQYFQPESFQVRHIFLAAPPDDDASAAAKERREKAEGLINDIAKRLAGGEDFAALAAQYSEDSLSAQKGGLLDWLHKGQTGSEEFDNAALALAPGETGKPLRTSLGFHIVRLENKKAAFTPPFAEKKKDIVAALGREKAAADFAGVEKAAEEALALNTPFAEFAKRFSLAVTRTGLLPQAEAEAQLGLVKEHLQFLADTIAGLAATASPASMTPGVVNASANAPAAPTSPGAVTIPNPLNTDSGIVLVRVLNATPSAIPPLAEVRNAVVGQITTSKATALAHEAAEKALPRFTGKEVPQEFTAKIKQSGDIARVFPLIPSLGQMPELVDALFASSGEWIPTVFSSPEGAVIARTQRVIPTSDEDWKEVKDLFMAQLKQRRQKEAVDAFMQNLLTTAEIRQSLDMLDKLTLR